MGKRVGNGPPRIIYKSNRKGIGALDKSFLIEKATCAL